MANTRHVIHNTPAIVVLAHRYSERSHALQPQQYLKNYALSDSAKIINVKVKGVQVLQTTFDEEQSIEGEPITVLEI